MKFKNGTIYELINVLHNLELSGNKDSRMRTRMKKILIEYHDNVFNVERSDLIDSYLEKYSVDDINKLDTLAIDNFYEDLNVLLNEFYTIENNESNKDMLLTVSDIMLNTDYKFSGNLADLYDLWCEEFESTIEYYMKEEV